MRRYKTSDIMADPRAFSRLSSSELDLIIDWLANKYYTRRFSIVLKKKKRVVDYGFDKEGNLILYVDPTLPVNVFSTDRFINRLVDFAFRDLETRIVGTNFVGREDETGKVLSEMLGFKVVIKTRALTKGGDIFSVKRQAGYVEVVIYNPAQIPFDAMIDDIVDFLRKNNVKPANVLEYNEVTEDWLIEMTLYYVDRLPVNPTNLQTIKDAMVEIRMGKLTASFGECRSSYRLHRGQKEEFPFKWSIIYSNQLL